MIFILFIYSANVPADATDYDAQVATNKAARLLAEDGYI